MGEKNNVELLAPAGSPAAFYAAVRAGADAVYLAGNQFGARAYAENFTTEELVKCIRYGHMLGRKLYLAVNTLVRECELEKLYDYIFPFYEAGVDAAIVQDFGVLRYLRRYFPELPIHASTQMSLCSPYGAQLLKDMGAVRIVPARELSLEELRVIKNQVDIELETFIHGAMCYCYSGQCLFSSILGGRSGNRGRCAQPCRLPYAVKNDGHREREQYYLSLKDMCTIEQLPALLEAGIDSFKIEGRMKKPEYAAGVTAVYRRYIDRYESDRVKYGREEAAERFRVERSDSKSLRSLYIRSELQDGYYFRRNGREMVTLSSPAYCGSDEKLLEHIRENYLSDAERIPADFHASFMEKEQARLTAVARTVSVTVTGDMVEAAKRQPITEENIRRQLKKLGESVFSAEEIQIKMSGSAFYPLGKINELRRRAVQELERKLCAANGFPDRAAARMDGAASGEENSFRHGDACGTGGFAVSVDTCRQLAELERWIKRHPDHAPAYLYLSGDLLVTGAYGPERGGKEQDKILALCAGLAEKSRLFLAFPYVLRKSDGAYLEKLYSMAGEGRPFSGFLVRSADGLGFLKSRKKQCGWHTDANVYIWNREAAYQLGPEIDCFCLPYELKAAEQRKLLESGLPFEKIVYSRIPMMVTANCVLRTLGRCRRSEESTAQRPRQTVLIDRFQKEFPVAESCAHCMNVIYNSVPLSLHRELSQWEGRVRLRIDFTIETPEEVGHILDAFLLGEELRLPEYTTGHEKRGAE